MKESYYELKAKVLNLELEIDGAYRKVLAEASKKVLDKHPGLSSFSWLQSTPFFYGDEPCESSSYDIRHVVYWGEDFLGGCVYFDMCDCKEDCECDGFLSEYERHKYQVVLDCHRSLCSLDVFDPMVRAMFDKYFFTLSREGLSYWHTADPDEPNSRLDLEDESEDSDEDSGS